MVEGVERALVTALLASEERNGCVASAVRAWKPTAPDACERIQLGRERNAVLQ